MVFTVNVPFLFLKMSVHVLVSLLNYQLINRKYSIIILYPILIISEFKS